MRDNYSDSSRQLAPQGDAKLTAKQETLCQLIGIDGLDQSEAYRQAYNVSLDTLPATVWSEASRLVASPKVSARIAELRAVYQERAMVTADDIIDQLKQVGFAEVEGRAIRPADKVAALNP